MRRHAMVGHRAPRVVPRRRLWEPDVSGVARELSAFERPYDRVAIADLAARGVHEIGPTLHLGEKLVVKQVLSLRVKWRVDRDDIANLDDVFDVRAPVETELLLDRFRKAVAMRVVQMHVERLQAA